MHVRTCICVEGIIVGQVYSGENATGGCVGILFQTSMTVLIQNLPEGSERAYQALYTANDMVNACNPFDRTTFPRYCVLFGAVYIHVCTSKQGHSTYS